MKSFARILMVLLAALAGCQADRPTSAPDAAGQSPRPTGKVVATVNGVSILQRDLDESQEQVARTLGVDGSPATERARLREQVLQKLIKDELLVQHAHSLGLSVSDEEVERREQAIKDSGGGEEAFARFVSSSGLDPDRLRNNLRRNMLLERLIARLRAEIQLDEAQLRAHYDAHAADFTTGERLEVAHLLLGDGPDALAEANRIRAQLARGLDFGAAVGRYSRDAASKDAGGLLGEFAPDDLQPVFAQALAKLKPGEISEPVQASDGVHLLKLLARTAQSQQPFSEVRDRIQAEVFQAALLAKLEQLTQQLTSQAHIDVAESGPR